MSAAKKMSKNKGSNAELKAKRKMKQSQEENHDDSFDDLNESEGYIPVEETQEIVENTSSKRKQESLWFDPDDKEVEMDISQVARLRKLRKNKEETTISGEEYQNRLQEFYQSQITNSTFYQWADKKIQEEEETSALDSILKTNTSIIEGTRKQSLPPEIIKLSKVAAIPHENRHNSVIQAIDFHKSKPTMITAGLDKTIKIFNIAKTFDSSKYELKPLKNIYLKNLPVVSAQFNCTQNEIVATGLKKYVLSFDLVKETFEKSAPSFITDRLEGKIKSFLISPDEKYIALYGHNQYLMMLSAKTKQLLYEFRLNSECSAVTFSSDSDQLFASTEDGDIYQWDLASRKIMDVFHDNGSLKTNCIDFSGDGNYLVTGNSVGIANLYQYNNITKNLKKTPIKEIENLTTSLDNTKFNPESEIIAVTSKWKRNAIRLVHLPSYTVFSNWPNMRTKLSFINRVQWSSDSKYLAIGNDLGNVIVYNFEHYNS